MTTPHSVTAARPASPCLQVCRLVAETCLGCHRTLDEIARWSSMPAAEREAVWRRLNARAREATEAERPT